MSAPRPAALGRIALFWAGYFVILVAASALKAMVPEAAQNLAWGLASSAGVLAVTLLFLRWDRRRTADIGLEPSPGSAGRLGIGMLVGFGMHAVHTGIVTALAGPIRFERTAGVGLGAIVLGVCGFLALSSMEELGFRGYPLRTLTARFGLWPAQGIVAVAFGFSHILFGWPWVAVVFGVMTGSLLYGMAAIASGGLAMPIGVHAAWNIAGWIVGEKDGGLWRMVVPEAASGRTELVSSISYVAVTGLATAAFWYWHRSAGADRRREGGAAAA